MQLERQEAYEQAKKILEQVAYGNSIEELEAAKESPTINLEEIEWERREKLVKFANLWELVCQLQVGVEGEQEGTCTCKIKDVYVDTYIPLKVKHQILTQLKMSQILHPLTEINWVWALPIKLCIRHQTMTTLS